MNDYSKLRASAEACQKYWDEEYPDRQDYPDFYIDISEFNDGPEFKFYKEVGPTAVLALIAENERLRSDNQSLRGSCAAMGKDRMSYIRSQSKALKERDQLKAEVETLRKDAERYRWLKKQAKEYGQDGGMTKENK